MPSYTRNIPKHSDLHAKLVKMISSRIKLAQKGQQSQHEKWNKAENLMMAYIPESELDAKRRTKREDKGEPAYTTIQLPYTYALVMSAHTYLTSVLLARAPIHQYSGRHGESEDQVQALEALIGYQVDVGKMVGPYFIWLYDSLKYGFGVVEEYWDRHEIQFASIQEIPSDPEMLGGAPGEVIPMSKAEIRVRLPGYEGNCLTNISPFDFFPDPRVPVGQFQTGEFCIVRKRITWETIVRRKAQGYYMNVEHVRKGSSGRSDVVDANPASSQLERPEDLSLADIDGEERPSIITGYECHVSVIPKEWGLGNSDFPEKWVFTITGDLSLLIGAQPHGAMHGEFPFSVIETEVEGYGAWNRGMPEIITPIQNTMDWLINTHFFNVRASMNNQFILDPSKIVAKDAETAGPGFMWRLRPEAYGQDIRSFVYQIPVQDVTQLHVNDLGVMMNIGEKMTGINDQIMGAMSGGGRKTATEVRTSTGFGVNRLKTMAEYASATGFSAHSQHLVQNSQQYFSAEKKLKIVGDLAQQAGMGFMDVTPEAIQGFFNFSPVDGTLPIDRLAQANLWKDILLQMRNVPGLLMQYDLGKIFAWVAGLAGIRNINRFRIQVASPQAIMQQVEAGNVVPMKTPKGVSPSTAVPTSASPIPT